MFGTKRKCCTIKKIIWQLKNNNELLINNENEDAEVTNEYIKYKDEFGNHLINLKEKVYTRVGNDNEMIIDFNEKILTFKFDSENLSYDIDALFEVNDNRVILTYVLGDDKKEIIITIKEEE